jgi:hypothetical protein
MAVTLSVANLVLLLVVILIQVRPAYGRPPAPPVLRGRGLEIVDGQGRVRASITVEPATTVGGTAYPETVLLRLTDPTSGPVVKLTAAANGSALGLSDDARGGIQLYARDTGSVVRVVAKSGSTRELRP